MVKVVASSYVVFMLSHLVCYILKISLSSQFTCSYRNNEYGNRRHTGESLLKEVVRRLKSIKTLTG